MTTTVQDLIDRLSEIDLEIAGKPPRKELVEIAEMIFGKSKTAKNQEKERTKALKNKKYMVINSFALPTQPQEMINLGNLALASYQSAEDSKEKEAWKNKMKQLLNKMQATVNQNKGEAISDEYIYLSAEFEKIIEKEEKSKKGFFRF